jgi:hypothetical protein
MEGWAIDYYGLRAAYRQSVLDQVRDSDRLHVSTLTWHPGKTTGVGGIRNCLQADSGASARLSLVSPDGGQAGNRTTSSMDARLHELHGRGVLVVAGDHECDPQFVADVEGSWKDAGLVSRPTNETFTAVLTADRLGIDLVTDDTDVHKLAGHWQVQTMTVTDFASTLAA